MKVTYFGHSGFSVETERATLLFDCIATFGTEKGPALDYSTGTWQEPAKEKPIVVFVSHRHQDHYSHRIWELKHRYPDVSYVLAKDIPLSAKFCTQKGITDEDKKRILKVKANQNYEITLSNGTVMNVETLLSTDEGVAFYVTIDGQSIFHAGDLHAWYWEEEGAAYVEQMKKDFRGSIKRLEGKKAETAFLLLDPRLEATAYAGMDEYLSVLQAEHIFPMHFWKQYDLIPAYINDRKDREWAKKIHVIEKENQSFVW